MKNLLPRLTAAALSLPLIVLSTVAHAAPTGRQLAQNNVSVWNDCDFQTVEGRYSSWLRAICIGSLDTGERAAGYYSLDDGYEAEARALYLVIQNKEGQGYYFSHENFNQGRFSSGWLHPDGSVTILEGESDRWDISKNTFMELIEQL